MDCLPTLAPASPVSHANYPIVVSRSKIECLLPHRAPNLFVGEMTLLSDTDYEGTADWGNSEAVFRGHFPGCPLVPGVFIVEAAAQLAGVGLLLEADRDPSVPGRRIGVLAGIRRCSFKRPLFPSQLLRFKLTARRIDVSVVAVSGTASADGHEIASLEFMVAYIEHATLSAAMPPGALQLEASRPPFSAPQSDRIN